jgi:nicotinate-nucleotide adenylyltransferase
VGHLLVTAWLRWTGRADEVWWVPVGAHAFGKALTPFAIRRAWCERCAAEIDGVRVEPIEEGMPAPTYTIDTLRALAARHPEHRLRLVVGADVLGQVDRWRAWDEIARDFAPIVVGRQGYPTPPGAVDFPAVASSDIRARVRAGQPVDGLVPASIRADVERLYSMGSPPTMP